MKKKKWWNKALITENTDKITEDIDKGAAK